MVGFLWLSSKWNHTAEGRGGLGLEQEVQMNSTGAPNVNFGKHFFCKAASGYYS